MEGIFPARAKVTLARHFTETDKQSSFWLRVSNHYQKTGWARIGKTLSVSHTVWPYTLAATFHTVRWGTRWGYVLVAKKTRQDSCCVHCCALKCESHCVTTHVGCYIPRGARRNQSRLCPRCEKTRHESRFVCIVTYTGKKIRSIHASIVLREMVGFKWCWDRAQPAASSCKNELQAMAQNAQSHSEVASKESH